MSTKLNRRDFLASTAAVGVTAACSQTAPVTEETVAEVAVASIPKRVLGQTGEKVSILAFGGGSRFGMYENDEDAIAVVNEAIDSGINYLDTAMRYGEGTSQKRYGEVMKTRRGEVFLATKTPDRNYDDVMREMERSLKDLQTDHVDLLHIHSLGEMDVLEEIERTDGALKALYKIRDEGMARFIGITSHTDAETMKTAIERHDFDCLQMALNPATNTYPWGTAGGFEDLVLPAALEKGMGILAMKIVGQDHLVGSEEGKANIRDLLYYDMSLPVAACVVGMPKIEMMRENIQLAREFKPLGAEEIQRIRDQIRPSAAAFNRFMRHHNDECHA
jgi:aryl-alcohol dehydrogenase-like predicted oxidoreductase